MAIQNLWRKILLARSFEGVTHQPTPPKQAKLFSSLGAQQAIKDRFASVLDSKDALMATATMPKFKLRWLKDEKRRDAVKTMLITECRARIPEEPLMRQAVQSPATSSHNDFFEFEEEFSYTAETEVMEYLKLPGSDWEVLSRFPRIKEIAKQYNTPIPSSAPVERLFSLGSVVLTPRRNSVQSKRSHVGQFYSKTSTNPSQTSTAQTSSTGHYQTSTGPSQTSTDQTSSTGHYQTSTDSSGLSKITKRS
ncbi:unnamed protein product [Leuciscus chuanchicus]